MGLLFNTDLENQVNIKIRGRISRVGGRVNQLLLYKKCMVEDFNVGDGGYGRARSGLRAVLNLKKMLRQEILFSTHGWKIPRDRKTTIMDMNYAHEKNLHGRYDATISSNVIEHSPNPIWLLLNFHFITKSEVFSTMPFRITNLLLTGIENRRRSSISCMTSKRLQIKKILRIRKTMFSRPLKNMVGNVNFTKNTH